MNIKTMTNEELYTLPLTDEALAALAAGGIEDPATVLAEVRALLEDLADMEDPTDTNPAAFAHRWRVRAQVALALLGGK